MNADDSRDDRVAEEAEPKKKPVRERPVKERPGKERPVRERPGKEPKQPKTPEPPPEGERPDEPKELKRRRRPIDAKDVYVPETEEGGDMNALFRKRLTFLMNGNNKLGKAVNIQELADAVGVSRPAIRKYLKPKDRGEPTTPSALTVCRIARYFGTTPDFLLGFEEPMPESERKAHESEYYNRLGLNQITIDKLHALRAMRLDVKHEERAATLLAMLDKQISSFVDDALTLFESKKKK